MSKKVGWLLDATVFSTYHDELAAAIIRNGHEVRSLNRPNPPYGWEDTAHAYRKAFPKHSCVVVHADIDLVRRVQADGIWKPGVFANIEQLHCTRYYSHFGRFLLNSDDTMLPFGEMERQKEFLFDTFGRNGQIFVRPDSPLKLFAGLIASSATFARDLEFMAFYDVPVETLVVVSSPKVIESKWRLVIANKELAGGTHYREGDKRLESPEIDSGVWQVADAILLTNIAPDPVWVADVCRTEDGNYHLLEIGAFSFSNLYGCDKDAIVQAVSDEAWRIFEET